MNEETLTKLQKRLARLKTRPVTVIHPRGARQHMDWIVGTTKYLSNMKKIIYDTTFLQLYSYNPQKVLTGCFAVNNWVLKIEQWCHIDNPEHFTEILNKQVEKSVGTRIYLDNKLDMKNVPFIESNKIRNYLLWQRCDGSMWFDVLKIVDPSGNTTYFYPSKTAIKNRNEQKPKKAYSKKEARSN